MYAKLETVYSEESKKHENVYGGYNDFPPGWRSITPEEFSQHPFWTYGFVATEHRQMWPDGRCRPGVKMTAARLFFMYDGTGVAMEQDYWGKTVRYYAFGCDHKYEELGQRYCLENNIPHFGRCWHVYRCTVCGHRDAQDSSD